MTIVLLLATVSVMLTAVLFRRGSAESKDPDGTSSRDADPAEGCGKRGALPRVARVQTGVGAPFGHRGMSAPHV